MASSDYLSDPLMIVIPSGAVNGDTACSDISLIIVDDELLESTETFSATLLSVSPCSDVDSGATVVEIINDDSKLLSQAPGVY